MNNIILIPLYYIDEVSIEQHNKYKELVEINLKNIKVLNINADIQVINKKCKNLRDMWVDIIEYIFDMTKNGKNVLYMEADTILFKNCDEIFNYDKVLCFGLGFWNMSFKHYNEFQSYEYLNSGLVYFPKYTKFDSIIMLYEQWPAEGDIDKLKIIFPNYNFNFGNRALDYSGTYWEYIVNILFYSQFNNKENGINFISYHFGLWKYNYRGCLYKKYTNKHLLANKNKISHAHFLIQSSNRDKEIRFKEIIKVFYDINKLINQNDLLNDYIINIDDDLF
jgi:hypothetical protein